MKGFFNPQNYESTTVKAPCITQCGKCGLYKMAKSPKLEESGKGECKVLFIGSTPDVMEDMQGKHFVGDAGYLLREVISDLGVSINDCWMTNAVICHSSKIDSKQIAACRPTLLKTIKKLKPRVIIPLGREALESMMYQEWKKDLGPIDRWIGFAIPSNHYRAWICPVWDHNYVHFIERTNGNELLPKIWTKHLEQALKLRKKKPEFYSLEDLKSKVTIITDPREAYLKMRELATAKGVLAFDYETTGLKPDKKGHKIVSVSFCLNGEETFACMVNGKNKYTLSRILKNPKLKKIASNLKFEERWTRAMFGHGVRSWLWDTMLAAHVIDNRSSITSIKFQAFIHLGIADYDSHISPYLRSEGGSNGFNRIYDLDEEDLLMYNGLDSLLEYMVAQKQRKVFK